MCRETILYIFFELLEFSLKLVSQRLHIQVIMIILYQYKSN